MSPFHDSTGPSEQAVRTVLENYERQQRQQAQPQPAADGGNWLETAVNGLDLALDADEILEAAGGALGHVAGVAGEALGGVAEAAGDALGAVADVAGAAGEVAGAVAGVAGELLGGLLGGLS